jgi:hypothetical protein
LPIPAFGYRFAALHAKLEPDMTANDRPVVTKKGQEQGNTGNPAA